MVNLSIYADIDITIDDKTHLRLEGDGGQTLHFIMPSLNTGLNIWRRHDSVISPILDRFSTGLSLTDVTVAIIVKNREIARIGADANPGLLSRLIGTAPAELQLRNILRIFFN